MKLSNKSTMPWIQVETLDCAKMFVCRLQDLDEKKDREADAQVMWAVSVDAPFLAISFL